MQHNKTKTRIALICAYFGKMPWYFPYFVHSCKYNPDVDFIIVTDCELGTDIPENIRVVRRAFREIRVMAETSIGCEVQLDRPYKLCDLKPAYGLVFNEYIRGYDFWGHIDLDIIFGDIRNFMTEELLANFDFINCRHDYISAWFALYRNCEKLNNLFRQSKDYQKVFADGSRYFNFDETNLKFFEFAHMAPYYLVESEIESMTHVVKRLHNNNTIRAYFDMHAIEGKPGNTKWVKGKLIYKNRFEVMLYHLLELKHVYKRKSAPEKIPDTIYISPTGIYS